MFPGVRADQGEPISTASSTCSGFLLPPACHCFTVWSLRKQGYLFLCPGFSFEFGHSGWLPKSWVLLDPMPALPSPPGAVLPAAALASTLKPRGSPSVVPKFLLEWSYFRSSSDCSFFLPECSPWFSLPASCLMCFFSPLVTRCPWDGKSPPAPQPGAWFLCFKRVLPPPQSRVGTGEAPWAQPGPGRALTCCSPEQSGRSQAGAAC